jgi:hypothetical protein
MEIIVKSYGHINKSFGGWDTPQGRIVKNRDHYDRLMKEQGMVSFEKAQEMADKAKEANIKPYVLSKTSQDIINSVRLSADRKGNVKLGDRAIKALIDKKAIGKKIPDYMKLPERYKEHQ